MYHNGKQLAGSWTANNGNSNPLVLFDPLWIGANDSTIPGTYNERVTGMIDEVKLYNFALTDREILLDYNQGASLVLGQTSTESDGVTPSFSADRSFCVPGDTATCDPPVAEWKFDEGSGSTVADSSGNNNTGTWNGIGDRWTIGKFGKAGVFNGSDDKLAVTSHSSLNPSQVTVCAWAKREGAGGGESYQYIAAKHTYDSKGYALILQNENTTVKWRATTSGVGNGNDLTADVTTTNWNYYCDSHDGTTSRLYVNGQLVGSANNTYTPPTTETFNIGADDTNGYFDGLIDDVRIYDYARTPAQIA